MTDRILVAVDDSRGSLKAAQTAARFCVELGAQVKIIAVVEEAVRAQIESASDVDSRERSLRAATNLLEFVQEKVCAEGVDPSRVQTKRQVGNPYREILEEARAWPADVIVMAVADRSAVRSNYIGSVTEQVIEFASCPVLVVPAPT
jgi:nucleotide-binding universal stress UspA family protein